METSRLAARQKRARDWANFLASEPLPEGLKQTSLATLKEYTTLLAKAWETAVPSPELENRLMSLERDLVRLNEEGRMTVVGRRTVI